MGSGTTTGVGSYNALGSEQTDSMSFCIDISSVIAIPAVVAEVEVVDVGLAFSLILVVLDEGTLIGT